MTLTATILVYSYGCLPPDEGADEIERQFGMRYRYRRVLTWIAQERHRRRRAIYRAHPATQEALAALEAAESAYDAALVDVRAHKACQPRAGTEQHGEWSARREEIVARYRDALAIVRAAERAYSEACRAAEAACRGRPEEYARADARTRAEARAAEAIARWAIGEVPHPDLGGPNSTRRRCARAAEAFQAWVTRILEPPNIVEQLEHVERLYRAELLEARHAAQAAGLIHGCYTAEEEAFAAAVKSRPWGPPRCPQWSRDGSAGIQIQGGLTVRELLSCQDTRLRLAPQSREEALNLSRHVGKRGRRTSTSERTIARRWRVWMRIGSTGPGRRTPVWASARVILHRPLPEDAVVMRARIQRVMVADHARWTLQLTLQLPERVPERDAAANGTVAIEIGWRRYFADDGALLRTRVAVWRDDSGRSGELDLPAGCAIPYAPPADPVMTPLAIHHRAVRAARRNRSVISSLRKADDIRSIRDRHIDAIRSALVGYLSDTNGLPDWLVRRTRNLQRWRSPGKFVALLRAWEQRRHAGDEGIIAQLTAWASHDRHLWQWEAHARDRAIGRRRDVWRAFAAWVARRYARIIVRDRVGTDSESIAERPYPDADEGDSNREQRRTMRHAAPGELRAAIKIAAAKYGASHEETDAAGLNGCPCGAAIPDEANLRSSPVYLCNGCGEQRDVDHNAVANMLRRASGEAVETTAGVLADGEFIVESVHRTMRVGGRRRAPKAPRRDRLQKRA